MRLLPSELNARHAMREEAFAHALREVCGEFAVQAQPSRRVNGAVERRRISRFDVAFVSLDAQRVLRSRAMIRRDPGEHLFLLHQLSGRSRVAQGEHSTELAAGDVFLVDSALPSDFVYGGGQSRQMSLHIPRDEAVRRLGRGCTGGFPIERRDPLSMAIRGVLLRLAQDADGEAPLAEALMNILAACCQARMRGDAAPQTLLHRRAIERIALRAGDAGFDLDDLANDLGVARRTLQRIFAAHGDCVSARLVAVRLELARSRIQEAGGRGRRTIAAIAYDCGFNDLSHFYHVFRKRFGMAPGESRRASPN